MSLPAIDGPITQLIFSTDEVPGDLDILHEEGCVFMRVPLALSNDGRWLITVDVGYVEYTCTCPCDGINPLDYVMFGYEITVLDQWHPANVYQTQDPKHTLPILPDRQLVIDIASYCYGKLLEICDPDYIYRFTWLCSPSANALKKHEFATKKLLQAGYSVLKTGTNQSSRKFWLLGRDGVDHSNLDQMG